VPSRSGLTFTLWVLLSATAIFGMLPVMQALATGPDFDVNYIDSGADSVLAPNGLISRLFGDAENKDDDKHDDKKDKSREDDKGGKGDDDEHDDDKHGGKKDKGHDDDGEEPDDDDPEKGRPKVYDQSVELEEDSSITIELQASADKDDPITFDIVEEPENGELLEFNELGSVTYEPAANFYGSDSFTFKASDGDGESLPAIVNIRISSINDLPVALAAAITTTEGSSVSFELGGTDIETEDLNYVVVSGPSHGKLEGTAPSLTYRPDNRFDGTDELTFKVSDGTSDSELAAVKIKVKEKDRDRDESDRWWEKTPQSTKPTGTQVAVSGNSTEGAPEPAEPEQITAVAQPTLTIAPNTIVSAVLTPNEVGEVAPAVGPIPDLVAPQLILPGSLLKVFAMSKEGAIVNYEARAIDDIDGEIPISCSPTSGSIVPVGTFNIVCAATDAAGNSALNSFMVAVSPATAGQIVNSSTLILVPTLLAAVLGAGTYFGFRIVRKRKNHG